MSLPPVRPRPREVPRARAHRRIGRVGPILVSVVLLVCLLAAGLPATGGHRPSVAAVGAVPSPVRVPVAAEPDGTAVTIDASVFTPGPGRHPAVLLAHGFGGSKDDLVERAQTLAARGYVVLAYTARGFGDSGGRIHLSDPDFEIPDAAALIAYLAGRGDVLLDGPGDPRVGVAGGSYGGALGLMLAGNNPRIDAVVAAITWHDLADAFFPDFRPARAGTPAALARTVGADPAEVGPFKRRWVSVLFSGIAADGPALGGAPAPGQTPGEPGPGEASTDGPAPPGATTQAADTWSLCARFDPRICRLFLAAGTTGRPSAELLTLLRRHSPAPTLGQVTAPTLLVQGMRDSLFGLDQADASARALTAAGAPVAVRWIDAGHDGGVTPPDSQILDPWLDRHLTDAGRAAGGSAFAGFAAPVPPAFPNAEPATLTADAYPGTGAVLAPAVATVPVHPLVAGSSGHRLLSPPGGDPAATTTVPGLGGEDLGNRLGGAGYALAALPGQSVAFESDPLPEAMTLAGSARLRLRVISTTTDATLFLSLWQVGSTGPSLPRRLVAPVRVATTPGRPVEVDVALPAGTAPMPQGSRWRVLVSATDAAFVSPTDARAYVVGLAGDRALHVPTMTATTTGASAVDTETLGVGLALVATLVVVGLGAGLIRWRRRRSDRFAAREDERDVPLVVEALTKTYRDGHRAVDEVTWSARRGQVVGLLGPNGAGKTTTMRMLVGLIRPDAGHVRLLGEPVHAGSPVLAQVGALIEGPGFLPHRSGRANLQAYWSATGRDPREADFARALAVAALGDALDRPVRTYSHGMKQRLGIAQAMLGAPPVLLLDEPTNGLDPPQIAAMRSVLRGYADTGRTVVVSSHLLGEVEQTCTHVVVMHRGRVVLAGAVADLVASQDTTDVTLRADTAAQDVRRVAGRLRRGRRRLADVRVDVARRRLTIVADTARVDVVDAVVRAGGHVAEVSAHRRLEEIFLEVIGDSRAGADPGPDPRSDPGHGRGADAVGAADDAARLEAARQVRAR